MGVGVRVRIGVGVRAPVADKGRVVVGGLHLANAAVVLEVDLRGDLALGMLRLGLELGVGMTAFR